MARRVPYASLQTSSLQSSSVDLSEYVRKDEQNGTFVQYNPSLGLSTNNTGITVVKRHLYRTQYKFRRSSKYHRFTPSVR
eukprot:425614-Pleurochrysis_carterae.AAC.1